MKESATQRKQWGQSGKAGIVGILLLFALIGGAAVFAATHHIVNTSDGLKIYGKAEPTFTDTYVDMTSMSFSQLREHRMLVSTMTKNGDVRYMPGGKALMKAARAGQAVSESIEKFDNTYQISSSLREMGRIGKEKYDELDSRYDISEKTEKLGDAVQQKAKDFNRWLKSR